MKNLFLTSSFADVYLDFKNSIDGPLIGKTVTFIPTASKLEEVTFYVDEDRLAFEKLGMIVEILDIDQSSYEIIEKTLNKNDYIFVSGGNTFFLLQELRKSQTDEIISKLINQGKPYIGSSAGSIILAPDIEYIKNMDDASKAPELSSTTALGIINFSILPHFKEEPFSDITQEIFSHFYEKTVLVPLTNTQFICIN
ncbi:MULTISPECIES: Type 1 glutamine amidotransferase-like domain-containing protein [Acinetobacter]|nr:MULTISPECIES: Type 1 glutamine amidotransferase-like domain-containing protein [Acinetobacter]MBN6513255.1 Type 1 glutamine amidotransferase-like domain-containing protein [Acinetobacter pittii]MCG6037488.1 Type 1 glutamine amidotransferase-like domain-containing protein [Acinetobacter baumannii]HCH7477826.1 Type 1 glutamine amidotransferase-like domain-containing protein [Acinetobacter baumannii]HCH7479463.1 Type 1 glutamine amidotransferase-like domain-containing protein [Acinetobacter bau